MNRRCLDVNQESLPLDHGTMVLSGSRETRTRNGVTRACFRDRFLIRPVDFRFLVAGAGIEPTSGRSERPVLPLDDPASVTKVRGAGFEPASPGSKPGSLPLADPRVKETTECPAGIEPASPAWKAGTFAARPRAQQAAAAGIEPASGRLTAAYPYQHGTHRNVSQDGWI